MAGLGLGTRTGLGSRGSPSCSSGSGSLFLISQSLFIMEWEGTGDGIMNLGQKLQDSHLAGLSMGSRAPQELVAWRITVGHLAVLQVLFLNQILGDELPGIPED